MSRLPVVVELAEVRCRNPACRTLLCQATLPLPAGVAIRHKCGTCNWYTDTVDGSGRLTMLSATTAEVRAA